MARGRAGVAVPVSCPTRACTVAAPSATSWRMACRPMRCWPPRSGVGAWTSCQGWVISAILRLHLVEQHAGLGDRPAAGRAAGRGHAGPSGPGPTPWPAGSAKTAGVAASAHAVIASLNARRASEYWTLARIECPQVSALVVKTSAGVPAAATRATRNPGVHRAPRPANAMTDCGRADPRAARARARRARRSSPRRASWWTARRRRGTGSRPPPRARTATAGRRTGGHRLPPRARPRTARRARPRPGSSAPSRRPPGGRRPPRRSSTGARRRRGRCPARAGRAAAGRRRPAGGCSRARRTPGAAPR